MTEPLNRENIHLTIAVMSMKITTILELNAKIKKKKSEMLLKN